MGLREDMGSWLEGVSDRSELRRAPLGRRLVALVIDWLAAMAVTALLFPTGDPDALPGPFGADPTITLAVFAVSTALLVGLLGTTIGHRLLGIRVVRLVDAQPRTDPVPDAARPVRAPGLVAGLVRTVLLCLVIPAVVWDGDGRGLHDVAARTAIVRG